ncbi:MAG: S41 family peptidase [Thermodesulfobacteriota bacterium]
MNIKRIFSVLILLSLMLVHYSGVAADEANYEGLSNFTRVLDLIERNYVEKVDSQKLMNNAIDGMVKTLDPYSTYLTPERFRELEIGTSGEFGGVGMEVSEEKGALTVITPIEGSPADKAGIKPRDQIIAIEGTSTQGMVVQEAVKLLRGPMGTPVKFTIRREGVAEPKVFTLIREKIVVRSVKSKLLDNGIGYVRLSQFQDHSSQELRDAIKGLEARNGKDLSGLVFDLRNNPGGLLTEAIDIVDQFIDSGLIVSVKGRTPEQTREYYATKNGTFLAFPVVILVNDGSASASEVVAEAMQDSKRAVILGTKTFGKGSVQTIIKLDDGSGLKLTTAKFYAPSGRSINEVGVTPDIKVENTGDHDKQLESAVNILKTSRAGKEIPKG